MGYMLPNIYRYLNMTSEEVILNKCSLKHNYTHGMQKHIFALLGHLRVFTQNMNNNKIYYFNGTFNDAKKNPLVNLSILKENLSQWYPSSTELFIYKSLYSKWTCLF